MWRTESHKLILQFNRKENASDYSKSEIIGGEFYDLNNDAQEWNNLYNSEEIETKKAKMTDELIHHLQGLNKLQPQTITENNYLN